MVRRMWIYFGCLGVELLLGTYFYVSGAHGLRETQLLHKKCIVVEGLCNELISDISAAQQELIDWRQDPAYREQDARHRLHMGTLQETWYRY
jgi:hypothetical protein